jgi:hypothetical protein
MIMFWRQAPAYSFRSLLRAWRAVTYYYHGLLGHIIRSEDRIGIAVTITAFIFSLYPCFHGGGPDSSGRSS